MSAPQQPGPPELLEIGEPAPSRQRPRWVAVTAVVVLVALGLGGLGGFLIARGTSTAASSDSVATACGMVAELKEQGSIEDWGVDSPQLWQAMAIGPLLHAAGLENPDYTELGSGGDDLLEAIQRLDQEQLAAAMDKINKLCDDI